MNDVPHFVRVFRDNPDETSFNFEPIRGNHSDGKKIGDNQLKTFIDAAIEHGNVQNLNLDNNGLSTLPDSFGNLTALTWLYVS